MLVFLEWCGVWLIKVGMWLSCHLVCCLEGRLVS